jgi:uncharacterized protein (TIGR02118 family)
MYRVIVCYGQPTDTAAFDSYYAQTHAPLVRQVPGLSGFSGGRCRSLDRSDPAYYYVANLDFATEADYRTGLGSPEMGKAGADVANFATGGVAMFTQQVDDHLAAS